jgi:acetyl-CoA carboxylase biotin carboxyl carrier protein
VSGVPDVVRAEMVGNVLDVLTEPGSSVAAGQPLVVLESMKMEIPVASEVGGVVTDVGVRVGDVVQEGDVLVVLG